MRPVLSRTGVRPLAGAAAALLAGVAVLLAAPAPARAETVFIEVNPSTVLAGNTVSLRASCGSTLNPAKASSDAFGTVTLLPENRSLTGTATVSANRPPHSYRVRLTCATGDTASTTLWVISATAPPTRGPNTGGGYLAHRGGPGGTIMIVSGLTAAGVGGVLAVWAVRRRRAGGN